MILGFGNNVVSALAAEITAGQKTIHVMPGDGAKFAALLTQDNENSSTELDVFAKITLTDSGETEFEICHLLSVSGDVLSVVRGQEGTAAKGWMLNDVVANFATRGSENQFVQIDHLQSGFYCSGVAGGSANALTLSLPSSFFLNGSTDWLLRSPIVVYPTQNNTGASTLQLVMGDKVLGTFPLYKGNKAQLVAGDILKDSALVCLMDKSQTFFSVMNPGAIYAGLGTAAFADLVTSMTDTTASRVPVVGYAGWGIANGTTIFLKSIFDIACSGVYNALGNGNQTPTEGVPDDSGNTRYAVLATNVYASLYWVTLISNKEYYVGNVDVSKRTAVWNRFYCTGYKQTAAEVGAMPLITTNLSADLNTLGKAADAGIYQQQANNEATTANHYPAGTAGTLFVTPSAYGCQQLYITYSSRIFVRALTGSFNGSGPWSDWIEFLNSNGGILNGPLAIAMNAPYLALKSTGDDTRQYIMAYKKDGTNSWYVGKANANSESVMLWNYTSGSGIEITGDGIININSKGKRVTISPDGTLVCPGEVTGAYSGTFAWADQYGTKAPFYQDFTSAGASEYHPLIKQRARLSSNAWAFSMGVLVGGTNLSWHLQLKGSGGQDINHQWDTSGNYNCPGQVIPGNYTNFDARYLTKTTPMSRLGAQVVVDVPNHATVSAPAGCVQSAVRCGSDGALAGMGYRPLQILVNGAWVNVQSL